MLIYNYKKEFLGIDEKDLRALGFQNLQGLQKEVNDFADLFVKTPGHIHNFKHVHWIDFITCAESNEESKVIINVNNKNYRAVVQIHTIFLVDNPASKAYAVQLNHLRELTIKESESISGDIVERQAPVVVTQTPTLISTADETSNQEERAKEVSVDAFDTAIENPNITIDPYEAPLDIDLDEEEDLPVAIEETPQEQIVVENFDEEFSTSNLEDDLSFKDPQESDILKDVKTQTVQENFDNGYIYDPSVASDELGLPLDLIEEFIQDFIEQAKEFKEGLYIALDNGDLDNLKILSHKLKGVAANLRIEDALEALTVANTSSDINIIRENLDTFYNIIAKLAGEEISVEKELLPEVEPIEVDEESLNLEFKEDDLYSDPVEVDDSAVPDKIEIAELADDTFEEDQPLDLLDIEDEFTLASDVKLELEDVTEDPAPAIEVYDKAQVANDIGLDLESFHELFEDYKTEAIELTQALSTAINAQEFNTCKNEALKLKGMSDNMRISSFSEALETLINSSDTQELRDALDSIKTALAAL